MIYQLHCSIKNLNTIFSILGYNVSGIRMDCYKIQTENENTYRNTIKLISTNYILEKRKYNTEISISSINTYNNEGDFISYIPKDNWESCCLVENKKDIWIPSTFINLINMFPDEYFGELIIQDDGKIEFRVKDEIESLFDDKNIITKFLI